jgi:predicted RNA-binding protein with PIN domain
MLSSMPAAGPLFIIDGYNLALGSLAFSMARDRGGLRAVRDRVFEAVARDCQRRGVQAIVVWDGAEQVGHSARTDPRGAEESFSRAPEKADERVIAISLERREAGDQPVVVSDDRKHVRADADRQGLTWLGCEAYEQQLFEPLSEAAHTGGDGRLARHAIARLVGAGLMDDPGAGGDALVEELALALAYSAVGGSTRPHKRARALVRWLGVYGIEVRGGPHELRALLAPLWESAAERR